MLHEELAAFEVRVPGPSRRPPCQHETDRSNWRPRTDSNPQKQRSVLDWYLEVG